VAWLRKAPGCGWLLDGTAAAEVDARLPRTSADHVINKKGASAFFGTGLAALLAGLRVDTVLICGATTSGCVRASAVDAVQSGFDVLVPEECVGDRADGPHRANLFDIQASTRCDRAVRRGRLPELAGLGRGGGLMARSVLQSALADLADVPATSRWVRNGSVRLHALELRR